MVFIFFNGLSPENPENIINKVESLYNNEQQLNLKSIIKALGMYTMVCTMCTVQIICLNVTSNIPYKLPTILLSFNTVAYTRVFRLYPNVCFYLLL